LLELSNATVVDENQVVQLYLDLYLDLNLDLEDRMDWP